MKYRNHIFPGIRDYIFIFFPAIFFGSAILVESLVFPLHLITIIGFVELFVFRISRKDLVVSMLWFSGVVLLLSIGVILSIDGELEIGDLKQFFMRLLFAVYALSLFLRLGLKRPLAPAAVRAAIVTLRVLFLYGVYELIAKVAGLPLFLTGLINNPSYSNALQVTSEVSGWIGFYRAQSVWPEPSFAIFPILLFFVISDKERLPIKWFDFIVMTAFVIATFSRTVWIAFFILILVRLPLFKARSYLLAAALAGAFSLALFNISDGADHSTSVRAETTRIGFQIASEQVYRGIGFNKFKDTEYSTATMESVIHNTVSSYVASMGWPIGLALLLFLAFPLIMPRSRCLSYMAPVLVILLFTMSDAFYFAPTYFLIAYAAAKNLPVRTVVS